MRRILDEMREMLREPFGPVLTGKELEEAMRNAEVLVTVGDVVTETAIEMDIVPNIAIVDGKTKRGEMRETRRGLWEREAWVCNPPGCLSDALLGVLVRAFRALSHGNKTFIFVEGEEDLAALPCINFAMDGTTVIYGMPDEGATVVNVNQPLKEKVKKIIDQMELI